MIAELIAERSCIYWPQDLLRDASSLYTALLWKEKQHYSDTLLYPVKQSFDRDKKYFFNVPDSW